MTPNPDGCLLCVLLKTKNIVLKPKDAFPIVFNFFPKNQYIESLWLKAIYEKFPKAKIKITSKICSLHFPENAFSINYSENIKRLLTYAVPVVKLSCEGIDIVVPPKTVPTSILSVKPPALPQQCIICNLLYPWKITIKYTGPVSYHAFPNDKLRLAMWVKIIRDKFPNAPAIDGRSAVVCCKHFPQSAFVENYHHKRVLKYSAVPVVHSISKILIAGSPSSAQHFSKSRDHPLKVILATSNCYITKNPQPKLNQTIDINIQRSDSGETPTMKEKYTPNLPCDQCNKTFASKKNLLAHIRCKHKEFNMKYFSQLVKLHQMKQNGEKVLKCLICTATFKNHILLTKHLCFHSKEEFEFDTKALFTCKTCQIVFTEKEMYDIHNATHGNYYKCRICKVVMRDCVAANNHECLEKHCDMCDFKTNTAFRFSQHEKLHLKIRNKLVVYECLLCKKQYQCKVDLIVHQVAHKRKKEESDEETSDNKVAPEISPKRKKLKHISEEEESIVSNNDVNKDWCCSSDFIENSNTEPSLQQAKPEHIDFEIKTEEFETNSSAQPVELVDIKIKSEDCCQYFTTDLWLDEHRRKKHGISLSLKLSSKTLNKFVPISHVKKEPLPIVPTTSTKTAFTPETLIDSHQNKTELAEDVISDGAESDVWPLEENPWPRKPLKCEICNIPFLHYLLLNAYKSEVHGIDDIKMYHCDQCLFQHSHLSSFKQHTIRWHFLGEMKYECDCCGGKFKHKLLLKAHMQRRKNCSDIPPERRWIF